MLIQGCGTTQGTIPDTVDTVMPPSAVQPEEAPVVPTPPPKVTEWPPSSSSEYVIKKGDSLSKIAARYGLSTRELAALNGIDKPDKIRIGQKLTLPGKMAAGSEPKPAAKPAAVRKPKVSKPAAVASGNVYVVKPGDCLSKIAAAHGCKTKALKEANKLTNDKIFVGQKLALPGASAARPAAKPAAKPASKPAAKPASKPVAKPAPKVPPAPAPISLDSAPAELPDPDMGAATSMDVREHIVGDDEDLPRIAMRYGVTVTRLKEMNGLIDGTVRPGQKIKIPIDE
jgi:LysM repeat protein